MGFGRMHRRLDDAGRDRVHADARLAYSIASDLVAAFKPPLVSEASTDGTLLLAWSTRLVVMLHDMARTLLLHLGGGEPG